jgi:hypothetical protein
MHEGQHEIEFVKKNIRKIELFGISVIVSAIVVLSLTAISYLREAAQWDPLDDYPIQLVRDPDPSNNPKDYVSDHGDAGTPAFYWDEDIHSVGVKCIKPEAGPVNVEGVMYWVTDRPPGRVLEVARGATTHNSGCTQFEFINPIPDEVRVEMEKLKARGLDSSVWHLTGTETPFRNDEKGKPRTWQTTSFTVIHEDAP